MSRFPFTITEGADWKVITPISGMAQIIIWQGRALVLASQIWADYRVPLDGMQVAWIERTLDHYTCKVRGRPDRLLMLNDLPTIAEHLGADAETIAAARRLVDDFATALQPPTPTPEGGPTDDTRRPH